MLWMLCYCFKFIDSGIRHKQLQLKYNYSEFIYLSTICATFKNGKLFSEIFEHNDDGKFIFKMK